MKVSEEEAPTIIKEDPVILTILMEAVTEEATRREVRILMVEDPATVTAAVVEAEMFAAAAVAVAMFTIAIAALMIITAPARRTKIIRAIIKWCLCLGRPLETALDLDAARPNASPRKDHGLVSEN